MSAGRALIGGPSLPAFDRESGSQRTHDFIRLLVDRGWSVTYLAKDRAPGDERYARLLRQAGVSVFHADGVDIGRLVATGSFDLAIFAFWHIGELWLPLVRRLSPQTRVLVDSIDLHFVRRARQRLSSGADGAQPLDEDYANQTVREINTFVASDGVLTVSADEADLLNRFTGIDGLGTVVPDNEELDLLDASSRTGMLFIGNFRHPPNVEAAEFLFSEIVPRIPADLLAEHPVLVVGNALDDRIREMARGVDGVQLIGWVPSVVPYLERAAISIVPLLHGAGTKRKVIQTVLAGLPLVSTSVGVEGLPLVPGVDVLVADDAESFAGAIETLLRDEHARLAISSRGRRKVLRIHGRPAVARTFASVIDGVLEREPKSAAFAEQHCLLHRPSLHEDYWTYRNTVTRVKDVLRTRVPEGGAVAVISKGDPALIDVQGLDVRHFPSDRAGSYTGFYPTDGAAALEELDRQIAAGVSHLLVPATAMWWLDHYAELANRLASCERLHDEEGAGVLFTLVPTTDAGGTR